MTYQFFCDSCSYKRFTDGTDVGDLVEVATSPIPRGAPKYDPEKKATVIPPPIQQVKKFKCPSCGNVIKAKKVPNVKADRTDGCEAGLAGPPVPG